MNCWGKKLLKDTNIKKRLAWAKKQEQLTLDRWKSVLWSDEFKLDIFGSNRRVFVRRRVGETDDLRMCSSHRKAFLQAHPLVNLPKTESGDYFDVVSSVDLPFKQLSIFKIPTKK